MHEGSSIINNCDPQVELATCLQTKRKPSPRLVQWLLPSIADVVFLVQLYLLLFSPGGCSLLRDADTGWHIRNGEQILATHLVPRTDYFSYTKHGQPWFAWEWLYDVIIAGIHHVSGLNGVVLFTAIVISSAFTLLFIFVLRRSGNVAVAILLTMLAINASRIHTLARPHVFSWLFTVLWVEILYRFEDGNRLALILFPPLMLLWVNIHGGFLLGLFLLMITTVGHIAHYIMAPHNNERTRITQLASTILACGVITLINPYSYKLYAHLYRYLGSKFLMNSISEFMSPNFHAADYGYFELFILIAVTGILFRHTRITAIDLLLILFSIHAGLYAARNIPIAVVIMSVVLGPVIAASISSKDTSRSFPKWGDSIINCLHNTSENLIGIEGSLRGHLLVIAVIVALGGVALNGGHFHSKQILKFDFDAKTFPVKAVEFLAQKNIQGHVFNTDAWSGYLIYKLFPGTKVYFDDRHDFYGETFIREYLKAADGSWQWREPLDKHQVRWILIPSNSAFSNILKENKDWHIEYDDGVAIIFSR